ncbi:transposase [Micromonosporaceae bacterium B7E4]
MLLQGVKCQIALQKAKCGWLVRQSRSDVDRRPLRGDRWGLSSETRWGPAGLADQVPGQLPRTSSRTTGTSPRAGRLRHLADGLRHDLDAVTTGLTLSWSSGPVEGQNSRVKLIKRLGYGHANVDLLRRRILLQT